MPEWVSPILLGAAAVLYFLPALVAVRRHHHNRAAIALLNLFLGWTGVGWALALVWAATAVQRPLAPSPPP
ncbi:MAG: superinfection immunity protein [Deltaproteobacteria bacterium]|nr:superinfection immunity protein [Deltaproteobacteria bacterium]